VVIAGNLPYYAATPILECAALGENLRRGVFLIQKKSRRGSSRSRGRATTAIDRAHALVRRREGAWRCKAGVVSAAAEGRLNHHPPEPNGHAAELGINDTRAFLEFVSQAFRPRKTLRNNLAQVGKSVDARPGRHARSNSLEQFAALYQRAAGALSK
jgi:16S rRNA A1518/A1519 N6-dimethyltransferase RsmA/KsgA/DIM1 with predicted DNA glycosylase/AP lyase activity